MDRASGILMHISSLPNKFGIGSFGKSAYQFVDFLVEAKQSYWQILPLSTTSYGDSPYQSFSAFAGNTHFIDFDLLVEDGYLNISDFKDVDFGDNPLRVDYAKIFNNRRPILEKAVQNFMAADEMDDFNKFVEAQTSWLVPYSEYMAIKESFDLKPWYEWDLNSQLRKESTLAYYRETLADQITFHQVCQYFFMKQYLHLKEYANQKGIQIIGDIPIYVARDSVEMWTQPELFKMKNEREPAFIAGTPPDEFSDEGQFWGNPIYDWEYMKNNGYQWWIDRLEFSFKLYDVVRIDHFRGFESFWEVPFGAESSKEGHWAQGPGYELFQHIKDALGDLNIIAEDLGFLTQEVIDMRDATGFPGMKILQFGFNGVEDSIELPHNYIQNCVAYVGTHDNMTARGWYEDASETVQAQMNHYTRRTNQETPGQVLNRTIASSASNLAIYTMQDLLDLDNSARMNAPSTIGSNWQWRMSDNDFKAEIIEELVDLAETYFRLPTKKSID